MTPWETGDPRRLGRGHQDDQSVIDPQAPTGLMLKEQPSASSRGSVLLPCRLRPGPLQPNDMPAGWMGNVEILHVSGVAALLSDSARSCVLTAISRAQAARVR